MRSIVALRLRGRHIKRFGHYALMMLICLMFSWNCAVQASAELQADPVGVRVHRDIVYATPVNQPLALDIYQPVRAEVRSPMPVLVIFHGGGWLINNKSIMRQMAEYIAVHADIVVVNVDYRLLSSNYNTTRLNQIVEDALGATLWVQRHIGRYQGDPSLIAVTGDSAGGHLAAMVLLAGHNLKSAGSASRSPGFRPSYLPAGETTESIRAAGGIRVQGAVLSYAVFDLHAWALAGAETAENGFWKMGKANPRGYFGAGIDVKSHPELYQALSPQYLIASATVRPLPPQLIQVGSLDSLTTPALTTRYAQALSRAGQPVKFIEYPGLKHAYLDSGCSSYFKQCFDQHAVQPLQDMLAFLAGIFERQP